MGWAENQPQMWMQRGLLRPSPVQGAPIKIHALEIYKLAQGMQLLALLLSCWKDKFIKWQRTSVMDILLWETKGQERWQMVEWAYLWLNFS